MAQPNARIIACLPVPHPRLLQIARGAPNEASSGGCIANQYFDVRRSRKVFEAGAMEGVSKFLQRRSNVA
jgi:hypothetical protein